MLGQDTFSFWQHKGILGTVANTLVRPEILNKMSIPIIF